MANALRDGWRRMPLKWAMRSTSGRGGLIKGQVAQEPGSGLVPGFSASGQDVWLEEPQFEGEGLVLSAVGARCGKVFRASGKWGVVANTHVLLPQPGFDAEFLWYLVNDEGFWDKGGTAQPYVRVSETLARRWPLPDEDRQRAIADFLDQETKRIDALVEKKRRLIELLEQRFWSGFVAHVDALAPQNVPLRRVFLSITDGPFGSAFSSSDYTAEGAAVVRLGNIGFADYRHHDQARIPMDLYAEFRTFEVAEGDLLIAGLGDANNHAGRACVAPDFAPAIVKGKCFRARVDRRAASAEYLAAILSSPVGASLISVEVRGSTRSMINLDIMKSLRVPLPGLAEQERIAAEFYSDRARTRRAVQMLQQQLDLLAEYRQALITAAVTGQLDADGHLSESRAGGAS